MSHAAILFGALVLLAATALGAEGDAGGPPRLCLNINGTWQWRQDPERGGAAWDDARDVRVPGCFQADDFSQEPCAWYRRAFPLPAALKGPADARWLLRFEKAGWYVKALLNGKVLGEHFGSVLPFEFDATEALRWGEPNELKVFVAGAWGRYALPGVEIASLREGLGLRAGGEPWRNWAQISGDVTLERRPGRSISDWRVETSVRQKRLVLSGRASPLLEAVTTIRALVFPESGDTAVIDARIPVRPGTKAMEFRHEQPWPDPVLWGFGEYGKPHLYGVRLEWLDREGRLLDAVTGRFGFRELWTEGRKLMFNGKELFLNSAALPHGWEMMPPYRHPRGVLERHQMTRWMQVLRRSGWNSVHNHFDTVPAVLYDVADEMGVPVIAGFRCDGPYWSNPRGELPAGGPERMHADLAAWAEQMAGRTSVVMWSPICGWPEAGPAADPGRVGKTVAEHETVRAADGSRPIVGADFACTKGGLAEIRAKIETGFRDDDPRPRFVQEVFGVGPGTWTSERVAGLMALLEAKQVAGWMTFGGENLQGLPFKVTWPSDSGPGSHWGTYVGWRGFTGWVNWCDESQPLARPSEVDDVMAREYRALWGEPGETEPEAYPEVLVTGCAADAAFVGLESLSPVRPAMECVLVDAARRAWLPVAFPGPQRLHEIGPAAPRTRDVLAARVKLPLRPGYQTVVTTAW
jgi:hypothetical protein